MRRILREPFGGALGIGIAVFALSGCELFSLDGLAGSDGGAEITVSGDGLDAGPGVDASNPYTPDAAKPHEAGVDATSVDASDAASQSCGADGGFILCNGACVDPTTDPANCNGCGNACPTGLCAATLSESFATTPTGWTFNGSATYNTFAPSAELTPIANYQAGTFVYDNPIVVDAFDVQFDFRMGLQGGTRGDGIGFMIERQGASAVGGTGGGLGMTGLTGFGVELDLYDNAVCGDTNADHVGVDDLTLCDPGEGTPTSLFASGDLTSIVDLGDAHWHHADVTLAQGAISVSIDGNVAATGVALPNLQAGTPYYFGFAGGTGGLVQPDGSPGGYRQEVKNIVVTFPTPRCL